MDLIEEIEFPNRLRAGAGLVQAPERTRKMSFEVSMEVDHHMESKRQAMVKQAVRKPSRRRANGIE